MAGLNLRKLWKILNTGWIGGIFYTILGVAVAVSVHQVSGVLLGTGLPIVTVSSESMVPVLNVGDIVMIKGEETYGTGDIIVFDGWETEPIIHRIVATGEYPSVEKMEGWNELTDKYVSELSLSSGGGKIYITKGDNNRKCDQCAGRFAIEEYRVYGKAVAKVPYLGWVKILFVRWFLVDPLKGIIVLGVFGAAYFVYKGVKQ